ncbi:MAG: hypothetical protein EBR17_02265 [Betaproteobacteria bacterium]|nr:hypothetical protein [Betaproteobacteria bacterium]
MQAGQMNDVIDQATGLRNLFGQHAAPVHVLCCPERPALTLPLISDLSKAMVARGNTVMWVDEIDFAERELWPLPCKVKFDLSKSLQGLETLDKGVTPLQPTLWYGLSLHTSRIGSPSRTLSERLMKSGFRFDSVIVSGATNKPESFSHYGSRIHCTAITGCDNSELQQTLTWLKQAKAHSSVASVSLVLAGKSETLAHGMQWMEEKLGQAQPLKLLGSIETQITAAPLSSLWSRQPELTDALMNHLLIH